MQNIRCIIHIGTCKFCQRSITSLVDVQAPLNIFFFNRFLINQVTYVIKALFCNNSRLKFKGISSESTTPFMNLRNLGNIFSALF